MTEQAQELEDHSHAAPLVSGTRFDLPPLSRTNRMEVRSVNQENDGYEEESIYRATDRWLS